MKTIIFLSISSIFYIIIIVLLCLKLRDVIANPQNYEHRKLMAAADELEKTKCRGDIVKFRRKYAAIATPFVFLIAGISLALFFGIRQIFVFDQKEIVFGTIYIGVLPVFFLDIVLGLLIIPLTINTPSFAVATRAMTKHIERPKIYKTGYAATLIIFIIAFPFFILSVNNYCCYDDENIAYSKYFQLTEQTISYADIESVNIYARYKDNGDIMYLCYEIVHDGQELNINAPNSDKKFFTDKVFEIHKLIEEKSDCEAAITPLTPDGLEYIEEKFDEHKIEIIDYIFEGFHR